MRKWREIEARKQREREREREGKIERKRGMKSFPFHP